MKHGHGRGEFIFSDAETRPEVIFKSVIWPDLYLIAYHTSRSSQQWSKKNILPFSILRTHYKATGHYVIV